MARSASAIPVSACSAVWWGAGAATGADVPSPAACPMNCIAGGFESRGILPDQGRYLLSPADLCLIEYLPELQATGVAS